MKRQVNDMERLTAIAPNGMAYLVKVKPNEQEVESPYPNTLKAIMESFQRLAEYENTGFTPEEHEDLKDCLDTEGNGKSGENLLYDLLELLRYRQAEKQGLLRVRGIRCGIGINQ